MPDPLFTSIDLAALEAAKEAGITEPHMISPDFSVMSIEELGLQLFNLENRVNNLEARMDQWTPKSKLNIR